MSRLVVTNPSGISSRTIGGGAPLVLRVEVREEEADRDGSTPDRAAHTLLRAPHPRPAARAPRQSGGHTRSLTTSGAAAARVPVLPRMSCTDE